MAKSFKGGLDSLIGGAKPQPKKRRDWRKEKAKELMEQMRKDNALRKAQAQDSLTGGKTSPEKNSTAAKAEVVERKKPGRPRTSTKVPKDTTEEGTLEGEKRATFIVKEDQLEKLKAVAYWERSKIKDVMSAALEKYLEAYEKKNGPVKKVKR